MILIRTPMTFVMIAIFATMLYIALGYPEGARFMPLVVGVPALLLCALQLVLDLRAPPKEHRDERSEMEKAEERVSQMTGRRMEFEAANIAPAFTVEENQESEAASRERVIWAYIIAFVAGILLLGYYIAAPLFLLFYLRNEAHCTWRKAATYTAIGSAFILGGLTYGLKLKLHTGFVTGMLLSTM